MSQVTDPVMLDRTGQIIVSKLQDVIDAINGGTIDPLTITQNGTYTPSGTTLGYGPVTVNVPASGIQSLTRAQWNALSTAQKQAYGLLAIQDANSGFDRGELVYGADYTPSLLVASDIGSIYAEEWWDDYTAGDTWGDVLLTGSGYTKASDAVRLPIGAMGSIALPNSNYSVTAYAVINNYTPTSGDLTLFAVPYAYNSGNQPGFFVRNGIIWRTVYGRDTSTGKSANEWHVLTLALNNVNKTCRYYIDGVAYSSANYSNSGAIVSLSAATMYSQASLNADVAWVGVVSGAESEEVILANHANIMSELSQYFGA